MKYGDITIDPMDTTEEHYKQVYAHQVDNLGEMDQFLKTHNLPKLMKKRYLSRPISI